MNTADLANPTRIEWIAPGNWRIWADEDGVHIRSKSGDTLEMGEVLALIDTYDAIRDALAAGTLRAPASPTEAQRRAMGWDDTRAADAKKAARATYEAIAPTHPF